MLAALILERKTVDFTSSLGREAPKSELRIGFADALYGAYVIEAWRFHASHSYSFYCFAVKCLQ